MEGSRTIVGNLYDKYNSKRILIKYVVKKYLNTLDCLLYEIKVERVLDLGCGEGEIIKFFKNKYKDIYFKGYDISRELIDDLKRRFKEFDFEVGCLDREFIEKENYDLVLCLEVLEHIKRYNKALENIKRLRTKYIIISVPNEPFFRLANVFRLKYLKRLGNTPGHVNNFTYSRFKKILKENFQESKIDFKNCLIWNFAMIKR